MHHVVTVLVLIFLFGVSCRSFAPPLPGQLWRSTIMTCKWSSLKMALTPIGPFCPFRSDAADEMEPKMEALNEQAPDIATEMTRIQMDFQMGKDPDKNQLFRVADGMDQAVATWETLLARLQLSGDFQTREYSKLTQAHLASYGVTPDGISSMMRWQSGCMRAMALNAPPPMPPKDLDLQRMMQSATSNSDKPPPSITAMTCAETITSVPFDETALKTDTIRLEYEHLCRDHKDLIELGRLYSNFDASGKLAFLDQIERIEDRWDVFFARFSLMGELNPEFVRQCNAFLESMNLDEADYRKLLKKAHEMMRQDAEEERNNFSF